MVKVALSGNGGNWILDFLRRAPCLLVIVLVAGCSDDGRSPPVVVDESLHSQAYAQFMDQAREIALDQRAETSAELIPSDQSAFVQAISPFEVWVYLAILADESGNSYALQQRFVRLQVKATDALSTSDWDFSQVVAVNYQFEQLGTNFTRTQSLAQRAAIDLAGANAVKNLVWVGAYAAQALKSTVSVQSDFAAASNNVNNVECNQSLALRAPQLTLMFFKTRCSQLEQTIDFAYSRSSAMPVHGDYQVGGKTLPLKGHGWMMHGWGVPPDTKASAVVFDRAWLLLDNSIDVQLQRSRRRSGRGPKITTGTHTQITAADSPTTLTVSIPLVDAELRDKAIADNELVPGSFQLAVPSRFIDAYIKPALPAEAKQGSERNFWFKTVTIEGSHTGYGFINLSAL